jgi:DNA-binding transcriptional MerR regulator
MHYRVEDLARAAGVRVDTVRFYQTRGLLHPPERQGRVALYSREHLERLRRIRTLNRQGLKLAGIRRLLASETHGRSQISPGEATEASRAGSSAPRGAARRSSAHPSARIGANPGAAPGAGSERTGVRTSLLRVLEQSEGERSYTRAELESIAQFPGFLIAALEEVGLLSAAGRTGAYSEADRAALESARALLEAGLPFAELLALAREHVAHVERIAQRAVALFEAKVVETRAGETQRRQASARSAEAEPIADTFRRLLPAVTRLVAVHFERALVAQARSRLLEEERWPARSAGDPAPAEPAK